MEPLGTILIRLGYITAEQLNEALIRQRSMPGVRIGKVLIQVGMIQESDICQALAKQLHLEMVDLDSMSIPIEVIRLIPKQIAESRAVLPIKLEGKALTLAMADPVDLDAEDSVRRITGFQVSPVVAPEGTILSAIEKYYGSVETAKSFLSNTSIKQPGSLPLPNKPAQAAESPIVSLVTLIITNAIKKRASDIHIDPQEDKVQVRYRIDGIMREVMPIPKELQNNLITRIKVMGSMNIAQSLIPQDGSSKIKLDGQNVDLRISTLPSSNGEKAAIRILGGLFAPNLNQIGLSESELKTLLGLISKPQGLLLATGPTGSGKTTTLYAALEHLKTQRGNIITIENPIEYKISGVTQTDILPQAGRTFANSLRAILRQDPDVVMVGEVRDLETAEVAVQASLTGRLILSTMHTNDTASAVARLVDLKIPPFLVAPALNGIIAQRLVRKICPHCKMEYIPTHEMVDRFGKIFDIVNSKTYKGKGCAECDYTGYTGRIGIFEILAITSRISEIINQGISIAAIAAEARDSGMKTLLEDGLEKVKEGITSLEEIVKNVMIEERSFA